MAYSRESVALAWRTLRETEDGQRAVTERWGLAAWEWIAERNSVPSSVEWAELRERALRLRAARERLPERARAVLEIKERRIREGVYGRG